MIFREKKAVFSSLLTIITLESVCGYLTTKVRLQLKVHIYKMKGESRSLAPFHLIVHLLQPRTISMIVSIYILIVFFEEDKIGLTLTLFI